MARITKSLFQATHWELKEKVYNCEDNQSLQRTEKAPLRLSSFILPSVSFVTRCIEKALGRHARLMDEQPFAAG